MNRLIDQKNISVNFKNWVTQHNPKVKWNFNNPNILKEQFIDAVRQGGDIDLKTLFVIMYGDEDPGITPNKSAKFLRNDY